MDLGNNKAKDNNKTSLNANFCKKCQTRVDVAQKMALNCPKLEPKRAQNDGEMGHPGAYDKHRREKTNKKKKEAKQFEKKC